MGKNRLALHIAAVLAIMFFAFLAIGSAASTPSASSSASDSSQTISKGNVYQLEPDHKPFDALGLIWVTSVKKFDEKGMETYSEGGVVTLLLKEAQKLGGNDILNLRVDENITYTKKDIKTDNGFRTVTTKTITYTANALAIKYK